MSVLILPTRFKQQPQAPAPIDRTNPLAFGLASAAVFDNAGGVFDRVTGVKYPVTNGTYRTDKPGRVTSFAGAGYVNTGKQSLGGVNLFADSTSQWSVVIYARLEGAGGTGTFVGRAGAGSSGRTFQLYCDGSASQFPGVWLRGAQTTPDWGWGTADWHQYTITWDGSIAKLYGDYDREVTLVVGGAAQESENIVFGARTGGTGGLVTGRIAYGYFYNRAIGRAENIALYNNPWQIFKAPARRLRAASTGGATHDLAANAQAEASATGSLTTQIKLAGTAQSQSAATASLTAHIRLAAAAVSAATASGVLTAQIKLSGAALAQAISTAALSTGINLSAAAVAEASADGMLDTIIQLIGSAAASSSASGNLSTGGSGALEGTAQAVATASADLTTEIRLDGAAFAEAIASAELSTGIQLRGNAQSSASASGSITTGDQLHGQAVAQVTATGILTTQIRLSTAAIAQAIASGSLTVGVGFSGSAVAAAVASGTLDTRINLAALAVSKASASGSLTVGSLYSPARLTTRHALAGNRLRSLVRPLN